MKIHAIVINLDTQTERMTYQHEQLSALNIELIRLAANNPTHKEAYNKFKASWERPMMFSEVSCYLNHKQAWSMVLKANKPMLIIEDDAYIASGLVQVLDDMSEKQNIDYINVETTAKKTKKLLGKQPSYILKNSYLYPLLQGRSGSGGYYLFPSGARKLLAQAQNIDVALPDKFINSCYSLNALQLEPAMLVQFDQCEALGIKSPVQTSSSCSVSALERKQQIGEISAGQKFLCKFRRARGQFKILFRYLAVKRIASKRLVAVSEEFYS